MLKHLATTFYLELTTAGLSLKQKTFRNPPQPIFALHEQAMTEPATLMQSLNTAFQKAECPGAQLSVTLADNWVRYFITTPPENCTQLRDCDMAAAMRFTQLYGEQANTWRLKADWHATLPFLTCAVPDWLVNTIEQSASRHALNLSHVIPYFIAAWNLHRRRIIANAWFGVMNNGTLTLSISNKKQVWGVRSTPHSSYTGDEAQWFTDHVTRYALLTHQPLPAQVQLLGTIPASWLTISAFKVTAIDGNSLKWPASLVQQLAEPESALKP